MRSFRYFQSIIILLLALWSANTWSSPTLNVERGPKTIHENIDKVPKRPRQFERNTLVRTPSLPLAHVYSKRMGPKDAPVIVLVHGLDSSSSTWSEIAERLSQQYQVIVYDQRGHGATDTLGTDYSSYTMAEDLARLLDTYKLSSVHLVGHSMGGRTVLRFSEMFPDRVKSVVVEDMDIILKANRSAKQIERNQVLASHIENSIQGRTFNSKKELETFLEPYFGYNASYLARSKSERDNDGHYHLTINPEVSLLYRFQPYTEVMNDTLQGFGAPVLFLRSDPKTDWSAMSDEGIRQIKELRPDAEVITIPGSRHSIHRTHPDEFLEEISRFLNQTL